MERGKSCNCLHKYMGLGKCFPELLFICSASRIQWGLNRESFSNPWNVARPQIMEEAGLLYGLNGSTSTAGRIKLETVQRYTCHFVGLFSSSHVTVIVIITVRMLSWCQRWCNSECCPMSL